MGTRAIIAVVLDDGSLLASNVAWEGDQKLAAILAATHPERANALGLVVLGDLLAVRDDGSVMPSPRPAKPVAYADLDALDAGKLANAHHVHLFRDGAWEHLLDGEAQHQVWLAEQEDAAMAERTLVGALEVMG